MRTRVSQDSRWSSGGGLARLFVMRGSALVGGGSLFDGVVDQRRSADVWYVDFMSLLSFLSERAVGVRNCQRPVNSGVGGGLLVMVIVRG